MTAPRSLLHHLLILGGTGEAGALARAALARFGDAISVTTALAGRTRNPGPIPGNIRIGGFGGPTGLGAYLVEHRINRLIDATHPFAAEISRSARLAAERAGVKRLLLLRPRWKRHPLDRWIEVDSLEAAALLVGRVGRRAWLTVGANSIAPLSLMHSAWTPRAAKCRRVISGYLVATRRWLQLCGSSCPTQSAGVATAIRQWPISRSSGA